MESCWRFCAEHEAKHFILAVCLPLYTQMPALRVYWLHQQCFFGVGNVGFNQDYTTIHNSY
jgi:hypothetical protein